MGTGLGLHRHSGVVGRRRWGLAATQMMGIQRAVAVWSLVSCRIVWLQRAGQESFVGARLG